MIDRDSGIDLPTLILALLILIGIIIAFWPLLDAIVLAFSLAVVLVPFKQRLANRYSSESAAAVIITTLSFAAVSGILVLTAAIVYTNLDYVFGMANTIIHWVQTFRGAGPLSPEMLAGTLQAVVAALRVYLEGIAADLPMILLKAFIFFLALYLFVLSGDHVARELRSVLPARLAASVNSLSGKTVDTLYAVYIVNAQVALITFLVSIPFFVFWGYGHVLFFSVLMGIFQLVPFLGPQLLIIFLALYAFACGDIPGAIAMLVVGYPLISGSADFYFRPKMMGKRMAIHPILMMIGLFGGLALFGLLGVILGPLFAALLVSAYELLIAQLRLGKEERLAASGQG
ncbi:MAG TPA: AI-2E family transporter [Candidatus Methanoculleus thermohydrogenotrophicum]|jgi:predicted PurR-regulated permease PerM|nr:AI-2E family transporter [Candidatus Methanoculleus thermohydrogenotrophicum]NLM82980.1 AI-2E family transporter [Candidatus Methanoculleus thermohydrogenotrophicum]HOB17433.1 AI-2E family transporter [Candidatus Methanoculleus thermohydrogenotrophicum]HPZ37579.1 AI-2E family transporter [Candidatus Methanoculleus thermohydrogenotrophicum]HQC90681.1 AI-2E family transporter [Candidatus Methanoculleus thermohydrogenotrophicum]